MVAVTGHDHLAVDNFGLGFIPEGNDINQAYAFELTYVFDAAFGAGGKVTKPPSKMGVRHLKA